MTKQEIIDELSRSQHRGFAVWSVDSYGRYVATDGDESAMIFPSAAHRIAAALRRNREALSLDAIIPMLEAIAESAASVGDDDDTPVEQYLDCFGNPDTVVGDIRAVLAAWKARRQ